MSSPINPRRLVNVHPEHVSNVSSKDYPGVYPGEDHTWDLEKFKANLKVQVTRLSNRSIEFDLVGVDASIANAFRRVMISEVPTICIEHVYVWDNTSVIHDEVLSHRLGLVPLNVDPSLLEYRDSTATDRNTLVFKLHVACSRVKPPPKDTTDTNKLYMHSEVLAGDLVWVPQGEQETLPAFVAKPPAPTNKNIVLAKLRPGQEIEMELHAVKGQGKEHAKWSPVATASYRLLPSIILDPSNPVPKHLAEKFQKCFSPGVIDVNPVTKQVSVSEKGVRNESMGREVFRHPEFEGCVKLGRVRDHFLFNVESEGPYEPQDIFPASVVIMREKIRVLKEAAQNLLLPPGENEENGEGGVGVVQGLTQTTAAVDGDVVMMDS